MAGSRSRDGWAVLVEVVSNRRINGLVPGGIVDVVRSRDLREFAGR
jgi:hypothetical protein